VNDAAIYDAITATQSPKWRFPSMFSAAKLVTAGVIVALFGGFLLANSVTGPGPADHSTAGAQEAASPVAVSGPSVEPTILGRCHFPDQLGTDLEPGTLYRLGIGVIGFSVPTPGWTLYPSNDEGWAIEKGPCVAHPGGWGVAGTTITFGRPADGTYADPCGQERADPFAPDVRDISAGSDKRRQRAELAAAVASIPGIDVIEGPSEFDLPNGFGEVEATYVAVAIPEGPCRGFPHGSPLLYDSDGGNARIQAQMVPRDRISVWIVDYTGHAGIPDRRFWIEAETSHPVMDEEIKTIIASVQPLGG
jgi:hypothetical protein